MNQHKQTINQPFLLTHRSLRTVSYFIRAITFGVLLFPTAVFSAVDFSHSIGIQTQSSYYQLKITLASSFKPEFSETKTGFIIKVPSATFMDLGVPFGEEADLRNHTKALRDTRLTQISVQETGEGLQITGSYQFPTGNQAFASPKMEHFDFKNSEQGKWILDFWYRKGLTVAELRVKEKRDGVKQAEAEREALIKKEEERRVAREARMKDSQNALMFCDLPFDRSNTVFIKYRPDHPDLNFSTYFPDHIPDHRFEYTLPKAASEEAEMVQLALKLSKDNKHALVIRTIDFLEKQYPKSKYMNEMLFLKASSLYRLEMIDAGKQMLTQVSKIARGSEVGLQAASFLAAQSFKRGEWLLALESFMNIRREFPDHALNWLFRYGIAECLYHIRQHDQAFAEYEWVSNNAPKPNLRAEAAFKMGDVFFERNQFSMALQSYLKASKRFKDEESRYPHGLLNLAESYFQLEEYERARLTYERFLEVGRNQPSAWQASLRIAEIRALNQKLNPEVEKLFTDTINRHPMTPGAVVARLRVIPCGSHGGFDLAGINRFLASKEITEFADSSSVYSTTFQELVGLTEVRALLSFGQDEDAIQSGLKRLRTNPSLEVRKLIEKVMIGGIKRQMSSLLDQGKVYGAMALYERYGDYLPLPSHDPLSDLLRMRLAKFSAEKGFKTLALKLIEPYKRVNELEQRELAIAISRSLNLEGITEQEERNYLELKAVWNSSDFNAQSTEVTDPFLAKLSSIRDMSKFVFERDLLKALFYYDRKENMKAQAAVTAAFTRGDFQRLDEVEKVRLFTFAGEIGQANGDLNYSERMYREARFIRKKLPAVLASENKTRVLNYRLLKDAQSILFLTVSEGEVLELQEKWKEAIALYTEAVENKIGGNRVLFAHARAVLKEGGRNSQVRAGQLLEKIQQSPDDDVWKSLASKTLANLSAERSSNPAKEGQNDENSKR